MNRKHLLLLSLVSFATAFSVKAQQMPYKPLESYLNAYISPFAKAMTYGMGGSWYTTANAHKLFGFDFTFSGTVVTIPTADQVFSANDINLGSSFYFTQDGVPAKPSNLPTIAGGNAPTNLKLAYEIGGASVDLPVFDGIDLPAGGGAAIQLGFGLPKGTDIMFRFLPNLGNLTESINKFNMFGIGVRHDIKQWIPVVSHVPFLEISAGLNYSRFKLEIENEAIELKPEDFNATSTLNTSTWDGQYFGTTINNFNVDLLIGASIPVFQPYIGLGYTMGGFNAGLYGNYPEVTVVQNVEVKTFVKNPIQITESVNNFRFTAGARLKLAVLIFFGQYTIQEYPMVSGGVGFTFR